MVQGTEPAHKLLELLILKALMSGKAKGSTVRLYAPDLAAELEQTAATAVDLVIKIDLSWDEPEDYLADYITKEEKDDRQ